MSPPVRKLALVTDIACSVGWLGGVATSLVLAIAGLASDDIEIARAAYRTLEIVGWHVLIPLSFASLVTGLIQASGTTWGLFRHYRVLIKLLMNVFATGVLLLYTQTLAHFAALARTTSTDLGDPSPRTAAADSSINTAAGLLHEWVRAEGQPRSQQWGSGQDQCGGERGRRADPAAPPRDRFGQPGHPVQQ
jgi:hypothetical protein